MKLSIWLGEKIVSSDFGVAADIWCWGCHALSARSRLKRCICRLAWLGSADLHARCRPACLGSANPLSWVWRPAHWVQTLTPGVCRPACRLQTLAPVVSRPAPLNLQNRAPGSAKLRARCRLTRLGLLCGWVCRPCIEK
jgi:hypothetical protein